MIATKTCPQCSRPLPAGAPEGLCPECLVRVGIGSELVGAGTPTVKGPPSALAIDNIARHFPQLEILEQLGQGGMGVVYKARQKQLDRIVALKVLPPAISADPAFVERFQREARALARLNHPNIVAVYDFGQTTPTESERRASLGKTDADDTSSRAMLGAPLCYFVMEHVDGANLRQLERSKQLTPQQALAIVPKICEALQFAHDEGIVHRDIKPENILVDKKGRVKIADFGLAKLLDKGPTDLTLTGPQTVMGTPHYMAPEQIQGTRDVDHRADIYSLGVVFYEMLTGELPLGRFAPPSQKVQVDVRLDEVVLKALEQEPSLRYQQASEVKSQVENISGLVEKLPPTMRQAFGFDYRSKTEWFGLPLVHIVTGTDPTTGKTRVAKGIIAVGDKARGVVALGGAATGVVAFGGFAVGVFALGGMAIGLFSFGALALALLFATGGIAVGPCTFGGIAIGYVAIGGLPFGAYANEGLARDVYDKFPLWRLWTVAFVLSILSIAVQFGAQAWARRKIAGNSSPLKKSNLILAVACVMSFLVTAGIVLRVLRKDEPTGKRPGTVQDGARPPKEGKPLFYTFAGVSPYFVKGPNGPQLSEKAAQEFKFNKLQIEALNKLFPRYYDEFVTLERQHTTFKKGERGRVVVTVTPFFEQTVALAERMVAEARGIVGMDILHPRLPGNLVGFGLFRHAGSTTVTTELWKEGDMYHFHEEHAPYEREREKHGGASRGGEGKDWRQVFPEEYWMYWNENASVGGAVALPGQQQSAPDASPTTGNRERPISYTFGGETSFVKGPDGPIYSKAKVQQFGFTPLQTEEVNKITPRYYRDFLALERQHTTVTTDAKGHVHVTIAPFRDEAIALAERMVKEIRGTTDKDIVPGGYDLRGVGIVGFLGLFRHEGAREVKAELWKDSEGYHFTEAFGEDVDQFGGQRSGGSRALHGKTWKEAFSEEYWIYWRE